MDWQPIEAAPRDGTRVLLYSRLSGSDNERVMLGYWEESDDDECDAGWMTDSEWWPDFDFTHWQPLPGPPND